DRGDGLGSHRLHLDGTPSEISRCRTFSFFVMQPARIWIESAVPASSEAPLTAATSATITATPRPAPPPDQPTRMADRYVQNSVCRKSVCMAALPIPAAIFRLLLATTASRLPRRQRLETWEMDLSTGGWDLPAGSVGGY